MDLLKDATKNLSLYEVKAYVRKAQNVAMNLTEMEAKVREATNNEPWGCPTTLMAQIAGGTYNYREREEIIGFIFRRFTEKAANEWRQIYKSLQLLEYLIKNGSERLIDDVRANVSLIQMLKSFHYIDSKGRDQGINVRNRAKNLINLLNDDSLIRSERKKARANQKKFGGVSSAAYGGAASVVGNGSGGYDDDDFTGRVYGDGGVYGERYDDPAGAYNADSNDQFEEYDVGGSTNGASAKPTTESSRVHAKALSKSKPQPEKPKQPEQDLLGDLLSFDSSAAAASSSTSVPAVVPAIADDDDDEFDDFQAAPSQPQKPALSNLSNLYQPPQPHQQFASTSNNSTSNSTVNYNINSNSSIPASSGPAKPASNNDAFSSLFSSAKTKTKTSTVPTPAKSQPQANNQVLDIDFFGDFGSNNNSAPKSASANTQNQDIDLLGDFTSNTGSTPANNRNTSNNEECKQQ